LFGARSSFTVQLSPGEDFMAAPGAVSGVYHWGAGIIVEQNGNRAAGHGSALLDVVWQIVRRVKAAKTHHRGSWARPFRLLDMDSPTQLC